MDKLKPCPLCGKEATAFSLATAKSHYVRCTDVRNCGPAMPMVETADEAAKRWNRRA